MATKHSLISHRAPSFTPRMVRHKFRDSVGATLAAWTFSTFALQLEASFTDKAASQKTKCISHQHLNAS